MDIPSFEHFKTAIEEIYGVGNLKKAYDQLRFVIENKVTLDGSVVTWPFVYNQFKAHIKWWDHQFKAMENRGRLSTDARNQRWDILSFLNNEGYDRTWVYKGGSINRDDYIFSNVPTKHLIEQLNKFKEKWKRKKD